MLRDGFANPHTRDGLAENSVDEGALPDAGLPGNHDVDARQALVGVLLFSRELLERVSVRDRIGCELLRVEVVNAVGHG